MFVNIPRHKYAAAITYFNVILEKAPTEKEIIDKAMNITEDEIVEIHKFTENYTDEEIMLCIGRAKRNYGSDTTQ